MNNEIKQSVLAKVRVCSCVEETANIDPEEAAIKKIESVDNKASFSVVVTLVETAVIKQKCAILLVKFEDSSFDRYDAYKILDEVSLDPNDNINRFKKSLCGDKSSLGDFDAEEVIKRDGSVNQILFFVRRDEIMRGAGDYSIVLANRSADDIKKNPANILKNCLAEFQFTVI